MLGIDIKAARAAWTIFLLALLIATVYAARETIIVLALSLFFAYMLMPVVDVVERYTPKQVQKTLALAIVYLALLGGLIGVGFAIGGKIADESSMLAERLPGLVQHREWMYRIPLPAWLEPARQRIIGAIQDQFSTGGTKFVVPVLRNLGGTVLSSAKYLLDVILVPILAFFFLKDGNAMREAMVDSFVQPMRRPMVEEILADISYLLGQYIRALVLLATSSFISYSLFLGLTGAPYAFLMAGIAGLFDFVPVIGPLAAGILVLVVEGLSGYTHLTWFLIFWPLFRLFQDYVLSPYLMGAGVELNPALVLFGVLAGDEIGGVAGMFFSVPVIATLRVIFVRVKRARTRREFATDQPVEHQVVTID